MDEGLDFSAWNTPYEPIVFAPLSGHTLGGPVMGGSVEEPAPAEPFSIKDLASDFVGKAKDVYQDWVVSPISEGRIQSYVTGTPHVPWSAIQDTEQQLKDLQRAKGTGIWRDDYLGLSAKNLAEQTRYPNFLKTPILSTLGYGYQLADEGQKFLSGDYGDRWNVFNLRDAVSEGLRSGGVNREGIISAKEEIDPITGSLNVRDYVDAMLTSPSVEDTANVLQQMVPIVPPAPIISPEPEEERHRDRRDDRQTSASDLRRIEEQSRQRAEQRRAEEMARSAREAAEAQARQREQEREGARLMAEARANAIQKQKEEQERLHQLNLQMLERMRRQEEDRRWREEQMKGHHGFF
jgi:hypothetical protein